MPVGPTSQVDAYLAGLPAAQRHALARLRRQVRDAAPAAEEGMGYGLPGFYLDGPLLYYGAAKDHCAIYGKLPDGPAALVAALDKYPRSKGTLRFAPDAPLPASLVKRLVKAKVAQNQARKRPASAGRRPKVAQVRRKR